MTNQQDKKQIFERFRPTVGLVGFARLCDYREGSGRFSYRNRSGRLFELSTILRSRLFAGFEGGHTGAMKEIHGLEVEILASKALHALRCNDYLKFVECYKEVNRFLPTPEKPEKDCYSLEYLGLFVDVEYEEGILYDIGYELGAFIPKLVIGK